MLNIRKAKFSAIPITALVLGMILIASIFRIKWYGDPRISIATNDTMSYAEASRAPLFSAQMWTGRRLFTTNLIYKIFEPEGGYKVLANGSSDTTRRVLQTSFSGIVILQLFFSIIGWGTLAFFFARQLNHPWMKLLGAAFILAFAYTPQIADWDSILMAESLTFSLFALQIALMIYIGFSIYENPQANINTALILWAAVFFFWAFLRDTNLFTALSIMLMLGCLLFVPSYRKNKKLIATTVFLGSVLLLGLLTASQSVRSRVQMVNIYKDDLLSNPARVETLKQYGMPEPGSKAYRAWFNENASKAFIKFMLTHPGYVLKKISRDFSHAFIEIKQTYFKAPELNPTRERLMQVGGALHPENTTPFLASLLSLTGMILYAWKNPQGRVWAWISLTMFLTATVTLIPTILGDTWAINRHALFSTMLYRLSMWLFAIILMDLLLHPNPDEIKQN